MKETGKFLKIGQKKHNFKATVNVLSVSVLAVREPSQEIYIVVCVEHYRIYIVFFVICRGTQSTVQEAME